MKQILLLNILLILFFNHGVCQQTVDNKLNQIIFEESFGELNEFWPVITNNDNFYVFDNGEYFMNRTKKESPYAIMTSWKNDLQKFRVRTSLMLGPVEHSEQSVGLICRASKDGQSAIVIEINKFNKFRVRNLINGSYKIITVDGKNGWIKNNNIKGINEYNEIELKSNGIDHDFFVNNQLIFSFRDEESKEGGFGLFIGPETKARVDFFNVYADELYRDPSKIYLTDNEIRALIKENEYLTIELEQSLDARAIELQNAIRILENQLKLLGIINEKLEKENSQYSVIKSAVDTNQVDLLFDLSHKVINSKLENRQLNILNNVLRDSILKMNVHYENLELSLFQQFIDKKYEEQHFIDSILNKFCVNDSNIVFLDSISIDSVLIIDSLRFNLPEIKSE